ncbi:LPS export ABC transporter periplasmic protein LptC [Haemophilus sp. oral taxon 851]|uniref:LPS export ABC transporter periplasmic protein LptC n=1 Tax=Haemophilus sp. oral taxon 851 TaxID=762964 RepID=UPI0002462161|nr:LPS export ABC transporter periplasmic protein LptC [Haemophilus sp. oral taxon 851]EHO47129.1 putative lipopolysaccharide export system protein LptC [Haemophilus sp. oral taxon 851 str. F0397]
MNIRWNVILGLIALGSLGWFYSLNSDKPDLLNLVKKPDSPDYIGNKMETTVFSPEGKKQYLSTADKVKHYTSDGHTEFEMPLVYLFDASTSNNAEKSNNSAKLLESQSWKLSAKKAKLTKDEMLYLEGDVVAESLEPTSRLQRIETQVAEVNLKTQDISSDTMVKINGQNFNSTGLKMIGNLRQQIATLKEQVKTYYEINK